jgi:hypothetical protein
VIAFLRELSEGKHERILFTAADEARARALCEAEGWPADWTNRRESVLMVRPAFGDDGVLYSVPVDREIQKVRALLDVAAPNWEETVFVQTADWGVIRMKVASRVTEVKTRDLLRTLTGLPAGLGEKALAERLLPSAANDDGETLS